MPAQNSVDGRSLRSLAIAAAVVLAVNRLFGTSPLITTGIRSTPQAQTHSQPAIAVTPALTVPTPRSRRTRKFQKFTSLPVEIREIVYEYAIINDRRLVLPSCAGPRGAIRDQNGLRDGLPAICFTGTVERSIAMGIFIRHSTFRLYREHDATLMTSWLHQLRNNHGFLSIRRMEIYYDPYHKFSSFAKDFEFLRLCPGLRHLTITIPLEELNFVRYDESGRIPMTKCPLSTHDLLTRYQFAGILECKNLQKLRLVINSKYRYEFASTLPLYEGIDEVKELIVKAYEIAHGRTLDATLGLSREKSDAIVRR